MNYTEFLAKLIDDCITNAHEEAERQSGGELIKGFEDCRGKSPAELKQLLEQTRMMCVDTFAIRSQSAANYGAYYAAVLRERALERVCVTVAAFQYLNHEQTIVTPTKAGTDKAKELLGKWN